MEQPAPITCRRGPRRLRRPRQGTRHLLRASIAWSCEYTGPWHPADFSRVATSNERAKVDDPYVFQRANWSSDVPGFSWPELGYPYRRSDNFGKGDIRRIVTLDSPLNGSPMADFIRDHSSYDLAMLAVNTKSDFNGNGAATYDLGTPFRTFVVTAMNRQYSQIGWFPVVARADSQGGPDLLDLSLAGLGRALGHAMASPLLLDPKESDLIVSLDSQGMGSRTKYALVKNTCHTQIYDIHRDISRNAVIAAIDVSLDLVPLPTTKPSYVPGYNFVNPGF